MVSVPIPIDRLPDVVLGRDPGFSRPAAFAALAASDLPDREELLGAVLEETAERPEIRTAAVVALGRVATAESERVLLANLDQQTPRVLAEIARSLGCIGSEGALARVEGLIRSADPRVAEAARFGAALIAHRLGLPGHELAMPAQSKLLTPPAASPTTAIEFRPEGAERRKAILEDLRRYPLRGVEYDEESIARILCAGAEHALLLNREISGSTDRLFERKALAGVVAPRSLETDEYCIGQIVLTAPADAAIDVQLATGSGALTLAGQGRPAGSAVEFTLNAVARPGALPLLVSGALDGAAVTIREAVAGTVREPARLPQPGGFEGLSLRR